MPRRTGEVSNVDRFAATLAAVAARLGRVEAHSHVHQGGYTTFQRPSATGLGLGAFIYDTDLQKPLWSDGAVWRDATGTAV